MNGADLYSSVLAFNLHFIDDSTYDFFKYKGVVRYNKETFSRNKIRWQLNNVVDKLELGTKNDIIIVLYQVYKDNKFKYVKPNNQLVRKLLSINKHDIMNKIHDELVESILFLKKLYGFDVHRLFEIGDLYPIVYEHYKENEISLEALLLLDKYIINFLKKENSVDVVLWPSEIKRLARIQQFVVDVLTDQKSFSTMVDTVFYGTGCTATKL